MSAHPSTTVCGEDHPWTRFPRVNVNGVYDRPRAHSGFLRRRVLAVLLLLGLAGLTFWWARQHGASDPSEIPLMTAVIRGPYEHVVLEQGEVESSNNVEVRCEVKNRAGGNTPSTTILDVIPEGTSVKTGRLADYL